MFIGRSSKNLKRGNVSYSRNDVEYVSEKAYTLKYIYLFGIKILYDKRELDSEISFPEEDKKTTGVGFKSNNHV